MANFRPLVINDDILTQIEALVVYAESNILSMDDLLDTVNGDKKSVGDELFHSLQLPFGYRIAYSIEDQPKSKVRHMSMSVDEPGKLPNLASVSEIMILLGYKNKIDDCLVRLEDIGHNHQAVNVWERMKS